VQQIPTSAECRKLGGCRKVPDLVDSPNRLGGYRKILPDLVDAEKVPVQKNSLQIRWIQKKSSGYKKDRTQVSGTCT